MVAKARQAEAIRAQWSTLTPEQRQARTANARRLQQERRERFVAAGIDPDVAETWLTEQIQRSPQLTEEQFTRLVALLWRQTLHKNEQIPA